MSVPCGRLRGMRSSREVRTGNVGASEVTAALERLDWGVADNSRADVGTDLLAMPHNARGDELCLLVGVQVKTRGVGEGPGKYFREPVKDRATGCTTGWWFRDRDRRHIDAWLRFDVPYLLVLHDANTSTSYWAHVKADSVVPAGLRGAKIFVPAEQTIDLDHRDQLVAVAASQRSRVEWEGSAWRGPGSLAPALLLRHALIVPRLVAPHPNLRPDDTLTPEQALALLVRVQIGDVWERLGVEPLADDPPSVLDRPGWRWQLVRALLHRLAEGDVDQLLDAVDAATDPAEYAAATVLAAATLVEEGNAADADRLLAKALESDHIDPIDHAWLSLQRARSLSELGRVDDARDHAADAQSIRTAYPDDLTASAIGGVGAMTIYRLTQQTSKGFSEAITGLDTTAVWWRTLDLSGGLQVAARENFRTWARDTASVWSSRDAAHDDLLAASLMASYLGDQGAFRALSALFAREELMRLGRDSDPEEARSALTNLRLAGDHKGIKLATRRLVSDGPALAVRRAASMIDLDKTTRTAAHASLVLLRAAGDVLAQPDADRMCHWLLATLDDPSEFRARTRPSYRVMAEIVDTLAGVVASASEAVQRKVAEHLANLSSQQDPTLPARWSRVARAISRSSWDPDTAARFGRAASSHHPDLAVVAHEVAARFNPGGRATLVELISQGSQEALSAFGDVRELPAETVSVYIDRLAASCVEIRDRAKKGSRVEGEDAARDLAMFNVWHADLARWDPLLELLDDPHVWPDDKNGALRLLARIADQLPHDRRISLIQLADRLLLLTPPHALTLMGGDKDTHGAALDLAYTLADPSEPVPRQRRAHLLRLLCGDVHDRRSAAYVSRHVIEASGAGLLVALVQDEHPRVRAEAAVALLIRAREEADGLAQIALEQALEDPGTLVGLALTAALSHPEDPTDPLRRREILRRLADHPSSKVRARVAVMMSTDVDGGTDVALP